MRPLTYQQLVAVLKQAGLEKGDTIHVQSALWTLGSTEAGSDRETILQFYLSAFQEIIGSEGTLTVCTSFEDYARYGTPFIHEESPSRLGIFSEYVRTRPGAVRSLHPIVSVTGLGCQSHQICGLSHYDGFGYASPWRRLHFLNAKLVGLGMGFRVTLTFQHYIEQTYGVPYQYTKLFQTPVYSGGITVPGQFTMAVRYLDFSIAYDFSRFEQCLLDTGIASEFPLGCSFIQIASAQPVFNLGIECLEKDRYFFLKEPPRFRVGEYPTDGLTGPSQIVYHSRKMSC